MRLFVAFWNFMIELCSTKEKICVGMAQIKSIFGISRRRWGAHNGLGILIFFSRKWSVAW
jgi:hypothetical protein